MSTKVDIISLKGTGPPPGLSTKARTRWAAKNPPKDPKVSFAGKTVLVTGSNTGVGYQAAQKFAALGASKLILAVRTISKGEEAKSKIIQATRCQTEISVMQVDMGTFASVKMFAAKLAAEVEQLDVVLLNAGIAAYKYISGPEGFEAALQVNILSTALLAILLLPTLRSTATKTGHPSQLTFTGSTAHLDISAKDLQLNPTQSLLDKVNSPYFFNQARSYSVIKLLNMYIMQGIVSGSSKGDKLDVTVNVACPGFCTTDLGRDWPWYIVYPTKAMQLYYARTAEEGSRSLVSACLLGEEGNGRFWTNDVFMEPGVMVTSEEGKAMQIRAWNEILGVLEKEVPDIRKICVE